MTPPPKLPGRLLGPSRAPLLPAAPGPPSPSAAVAAARCFFRGGGDTPPLSESEEEEEEARVNVVCSAAAAAAVVGSVPVRWVRGRGAPPPPRGEAGDLSAPPRERRRRFRKVREPHDRQPSPGPAAAAGFPSLLPVSCPASPAVTVAAPAALRLSPSSSAAARCCLTPSLAGWMDRWTHLLTDVRSAFLRVNPHLALRESPAISSGPAARHNCSAQDHRKFQ
ncbi:small nuclear ribonucleoprotein-associated protein B'-like [Amblyraja radiata]|uniref:small nuclear ribonucleoprotein-associated protein B'-like n=1 Tax=Amblyraja radiata TaxID=386614 RepID=UPI001401DACA|nr:small nuclear ribonucleoprotein-associated protein B'-like [Amblyraja radiata]